MAIPEIDWKRTDILIQLALEEDLGDIGDATTNAVIPADLKATAVLIAKEELVCAGLPVAERLFHTLDPNIVFTSKVREGELCPRGTIMAEITGPARMLLTGERTALNFLQRLCGVATASHQYQELAGNRAEILDTRKTTPGWRNLEKYAVATGGAHNHRIGLYDRIMIKDNHRELAGMEGKGGILRSVRRAREMYPQLEVEVEVDSLEELDEALLSGAEYILLDNMDNEQVVKAVGIARNKARLEASGNVTLGRIPTLSETGVDYISSGALTHSVKSSDISMDIRI
ncbi:MAG: carboxylating nicotinate-nucleotide diphosphorylase [Lentisphaeria bacterium]|jgi:nicotinate-nucleotide pyrophosphorylase (carboxylating)|nr:carboxylating nicotinate-nucleotide diphosphorylase [Lentisphaeria bacterium]MDD6338019.1 carboxylating nicotinate-nucleotide diphosphorylase [Lentisphaeria bacterium]